LWRQAFDAVDSRVAPRLEEATRSSAFAELLSLAARAQAGVRGEFEARTRRLWHLVNLPAGSDVTRLRRQVAGLDREVRQLTAVLERTLEERDGKEVDDEPVAQPGHGAGGSRSPGRRAQRSPRP
jgi:hypothetical protein